jgi:hypothetical protein
MLFCFFKGGKRMRKKKKSFKIDIITKIKTKIKDRKDNRKWKMYLYANNQCVKCVKIPKEESPFENTYIISIFFKKHLVGCNYAKVIVKPYKLKYTDENKKCIHIETKLYEGVEIK